MEERSSVATRFDDIWQEDPELYALLRDSPTLEVARKRTFDYLNHQELLFLNHDFNTHALELATVLDCVDAMKQIAAVRNEKVSGTSAIKHLQDAAQGHEPSEKLSPGFIEEFRHLFRALRGRSKLYPEPVGRLSKRLSGRAAARVRSRGLDQMAVFVEERIRRYPTGLDRAVAERRRANRRRIMEALACDRRSWTDYKWQTRHIIRDADTLGRLIRLAPEEREAIDAAVECRLPFGVTPYYASLMDFNASRILDHAVRAQVIPTPDYVAAMRANRDQGLHSLDFMHESDTSPIDLVTRRYPQIAILKPFNACPQVCVYCQRNWEIAEPMAAGAAATPARIDAAIRWFRRRRYLTEVLVTGGDPLAAGTDFNVRIIEQLARIRHIQRIRIGSRVPVTLPMRITPKLAAAIARFHKPGRREICLVTHIQHVYEITAETVHAIQELRSRGISVYNQMVFTRENSRRFEAAALRRLLRLVGVDPYYTFSTKGKEETVDYRVPIARLLQEQKEETRLMPGLVRTDEAVFNVPGMGKNYVRARQHHRLIMVRPDGRRVYEFHPWEKGISLAPTYIHVDVGIWEYLGWLKSVGENTRDYRSIWYYH
ncbi:KamA family radical SAM protein [candidate division WOR-3 bacterium]|nr:KamA family radical SAM protein [candidate division WOR-3 bacterium]